MAAAAAYATTCPNPAVLVPRLPTSKPTARCSALPCLPPRLSSTPFPASAKRFSGVPIRNRSKTPIQDNYLSLQWRIEPNARTMDLEGSQPTHFHARPIVGSRRSSLLQIRASSSEETSASIDTSELFSDLKEKWDAIENKSTVILYGGGAIVAVWLSSIVVGAINSVPLLPKIMELVGLGYTGWFVYRYLLFKSSRKELATDIEALKKKIAGTE
ncbi:Protein CURVATURE THYLAKOID 1A, chloroplastic [Morella rubra]|uniref:Protein CURVATURE THYLAKOID 1A, chloroplastic n=1 Tax=Morella rubra TaxID=262757 RepID=A0A6A1W5E5_9ROSI|nr:Protein CURVATURE THYLAKOID 1A, chloroplastic [Morella rubra]